MPEITSTNSNTIRDSTFGADEGIKKAPDVPGPKEKPEA
jgi:hypothetical protein